MWPPEPAGSDQHHRTNVRHLYEDLCALLGERLMYTGSATSCGKVPAALFVIFWSALVTSS